MRAKEDVFEYLSVHIVMLEKKKKTDAFIRRKNSRHGTNECLADGAQFSCGLLAVSENTFTNFAN